MLMKNQGLHERSGFRNIPFTMSPFAEIKIQKKSEERFYTAAAQENQKKRRMTLNC